MKEEKLKLWKLFLLKPWDLGSIMKQTRLEFTELLEQIFNPKTKIGKQLICFSTHGCMAQIHEFKWIGIIEGTTYPRLCDDLMFYKVKVLKDAKGELRDSGEVKYEEVYCNDIQDLGGALITYK